MLNFPQIAQVQECRADAADDGIAKCGEFQHRAPMAAGQSYTGHEPKSHDKGPKRYTWCTHMMSDSAAIGAAWMDQVH